MSRNRSSSLMSAGAPARAMPASTVLGQPVLRDRDGDLAWLGLHQSGEGKHGAVGKSTEDAKNHKETDQTRHRQPIRPSNPPHWRHLPRSRRATQMRLEMPSS